MHNIMIKNTVSYISILTMFLTLGFNTLYAQDEESTEGGKYGATDEDSISCVENLSVYKDFLREKNYSKAFGFLRKAYQICPASSLKMYVDAENILSNLIKENSSDKARQKGLVDTLLLLYDIRIENFGKEGYVLGKKGAAMLKYNQPGYEAAYNTLKRSIEIDGVNSQAAAIIYYFQAAVKMSASKPQPADFWVEMFNECSIIIEHNLTTSKDPRQIEAYNLAQENVIKMADPYLSCEVLVKFFSGKFEEKKDNQSWLEGAAKILDKKDCSGDPIFFKIANRLHTLNPSANSAKNMGIMSMKKANYNDAVKFFIQAIDMADDMTDDENYNLTLSDLELWLSKAYFGQKNYPLSRTHAQKAAGFRDNWGEPYMLIGDLYASSVSLCTEGPDGALKSPYWVAVDMYQKAKSVDPGVAEDAKQKIAKYSQYFPSTQDAFFHAVTEGKDYTVGCWINEVTKARLR